MENHNFDNSLEEFLQRETSQHRMYPSDHIWRNIHKELHGKKQWPALTITAVLMTTALCISTILNDYPSELQYKKLHTNSGRNLNLFQNTYPFFSGLNNNKKSDINHKLNYQKTTSNTVETRVYNNSKIDDIETNAKQNVVVSNVAIASNKTQNVYQENKFNNTSNKLNKIEKVSLNINNSSEIALISNKALTDIPAKKIYFPTIKNSKIHLTEPQLQIPSLQKNKSSKFELDIYVTPSISYRKLLDDKLRNNFEPAPIANGPIAPAYTQNINDVVKHKAAMGSEIGIGIMYHITNNLKFKTGLQYNIRKYYIDSYKSGSTVAGIAIIRNNRLDTINQITNLSANLGYAETQLDTKLYQVSVPIGIQWDFLHYKKFGLTFGGSIEPTITLNKNVYLISTDYKYYTDGTPFLRKWNINSSAQLNLTYKAGNYQLYAGPQIRYQHLPTYNDQYPIKEFRMDYGFRIGFTKRLLK
jgi:hypothetical protein